MCHVFNERTRREDYRTGVLTAVIRGVVGDKRAKVFDYFPQHEEQTSQSQHPREVFASLMRLAKRKKSKGEGRG